MTQRVWMNNINEYKIEIINKHWFIFEYAVFDSNISYLNWKCIKNMAINNEINKNVSI